MKIRSTQVGGAQIGLAQVRAVQVSITEIRFSEVDALQACLGEISPTQIGSAQVDDRVGAVDQPRVAQEQDDESFASSIETA